MVLKKVNFSLISVARLTSNFKFKIFGYDYLQVDHLDNLVHTYAALFISTKITHSPFLLLSNESMQTAATSININTILTSIISTYFILGHSFPSENLSLNHQSLNYSFIIDADFNEA